MSFNFVHPDELANPAPGLATNYVNYWWMVDDQGRIAFYVGHGSGKYHHPQCNVNEQISRDLVATQTKRRERGNYGSDAWAVDVVQLPLVSVPARASDYSH